VNAHSVPEIGKSLFVPGNTVEDAVRWAEELQQHEYRGLGDTREAARYRVSKKTGIPESYLKRLRYKAEELLDVPASIYLRLAFAYERACLATERKTQEIRDLRHSLRTTDHEVDQEHGGARR